jgi:hypothetical protein
MTIKEEEEERKGAEAHVACKDDEGDGRSSTWTVSE